jgi:hypothetical protein
MYFEKKHILSQSNNLNKNCLI